MAPSSVASTFLEAGSSSQARLKARNLHRNRRNSKYGGSSQKMKETVRRLKEEMREISEQQANIRQGQRKVREKLGDIEAECRRLAQSQMREVEENQAKIEAGFQDVRLQHENAMLRKQLKEKKAKCRAFLERLMTLEKEVEHNC